MDTAAIIGLLQESIFTIVVFVASLLFAMLRGKQAITNLILALYLALLVSLKFPYYDFFLGNGEPGSDAIIMIVIFAIFTILGTLLFGRLMPTEFKETAFEEFGKKVIFAVLATVLVLAYSYHALPVTELVSPGSPIQTFFAPENNFFWWLLLPLVGIFLL